MKEGNLFSGSVLKNLLMLAVPIVLGNLLQIAYQITDMFWIGRLGKEAVASISLAFPITFFFTSIAIGLTIAGSILVAQYFGRRDYKGMNHVVGQTLLSSLSVAVILSTLGFFLAPFIVSLMGAEKIVTSGAISYLKIYFIGNIFVFGYLSIQSLLRGIREVKIPLLIVFGTVLLNIVVDPLFINGFWIIPALGIKGAAAATMLTQFIAFIIGVGILENGKGHMKLKFRELRPDFKLIKKIFSLGLPTSLGISSKSLAMIILSFIVAGFGTVITAAYGIGAQIYGVAILPAIGISMAASTLVGQGIGARKKEFVSKVAKRSILTIVTFMIVLSTIIFFFASNFASALIKDNPDVVREAATFLRILCLGYVFLGIQQTANGLFQGAGRTKLSMTITLIGLWLIQLPFAYFVSKFTSLSYFAIWWAYPISFFVISIISTTILIRGKWKDKELLEEMQ